MTLGLSECMSKWKKSASRLNLFGCNQRKMELTEWVLSHSMHHHK